jgi:allantoin racemase
MGLRIWHQSFTTLADVPLYRDGLTARIAEVVRPDTEVVLHGQVPGTYSSDYPGTDLGFSALFWLHGLQWIAACREAQRQGYDAVVMATMSNPLIREIRTLVDIPVIGYGETSMHLSAQYGRRFGMLCFMAGREDFWPEAARQWGCAERFAGVLPLDLGFPQLLVAYADPQARQSVVDQVVAAGEQLVRTTGADVIIPSEMPLNLLLAQAGVHEIAGATVLDGLAASFKIAETMCDLRHVTGMRPSRRGFFHGRPNPGRVEQVLAFYGVDQLAGRISEG